MVRQVVGDRDVEKTSKSNKIKSFKNEDEEKAYQEIKDTFDIEAVKILWKPDKMKFTYMTIDDENQVAELYYKYKKKIMVYFINLSYSDNSWGVDIEDEVLEEYEKQVNGCSIDIKEYKIKDNNVNKYTAKFRYKKVEYFLVATMEKEEFEKILNNLFFS